MNVVKYCYHIEPVSKIRLIVVLALTVHIQNIYLKKKRRKLIGPIDFSQATKQQK